MKDKDDPIMMGIFGGLAFIGLLIVLEPYLPYIFALVVLAGLGVGGFYAWRIYERTHYRSKKVYVANPSAPPPPDSFDYQEHAQYRERVKSPDAQAPMKPSEASRLEHCLVVGGSGHGKSQLLEWLILPDLKRTRPPAIVVLDSKSPHEDYHRSNMTDRISRLDIFKERLRDKLIIIDPRDRPALSLFDAPPEEHNHAAAEVSYFLGTLFEGEVSPTMAAAYQPLVSLMLHVSKVEQERGRPDKKANFDKLLEAVRNIKQFDHYIDTMPNEVMRKYLKVDFRVSGLVTKTTQNAIARRIHGMLMPSDDFGAMFNARSNKLNLVDALDHGHVVLINNDIGHLDEHLSAVFGKAMISRVLTAARTRKTRNPVWFIIDEAYPYTDKRTQNLLRQLRSYGLGATFAYQDFKDVETSLQRTLANNTTVKYVGGGSPEHASFFSQIFRVSPDFIMEQTKDPKEPPEFTRFAYHIKDKMAAAQSMTLPLGLLDKEPRMSDEDYEQLRVSNRLRLQEN